MGCVSTTDMACRGSHLGMTGDINAGILLRGVS